MASFSPFLKPVRKDFSPARQFSSLLVRQSATPARHDQPENADLDRFQAKACPH
jgi:hypothetical protein